MTEQGPLLANLLSQKERDNQRLSLNPNPISSVENFLIDLQQKIRVLFKSEYEAYRFFDINENQKCSKEHFLFTCQFLHLEHYTLPDVLDLFNAIDTKQDGYIDETEFQNIFKGV